MGYIDSHVHVWTDDFLHYPLGDGWKPEDMAPRRFTPDDLFKHTRANGVSRINLIQMSYYGPKAEPATTAKRFDNSYMLDMIRLHKGAFVGTAIVDPEGKDVAREMADLAKRGVRAFRVYPALTRAPVARWLQPDSYNKMFQAAARNNQAVSCLIGPDALPDLDRMCKKHPGAPVIIDHLARIGIDGAVRDADVKALCDMARHKRVLVKVGAFYALGKKKAPYTDLAPLIEKVVTAFGVDRCMWESDCPFQVVGGHTYKDSLDLVRSKLAFLSDGDRDWLLCKTAEKFFFTP